MVTEAAFRIIRRAVSLRIQQGETPIEVIDSYPKLSEEQKQCLINEFIQ